MEELKEKQPKQVRIATGDMADASVPRDAVAMAVAEFGQLDGIVINHGMLDTAQRIAQADVSHWKHAFDINFFSAVSLVCAPFRPEYISDRFQLEAAIPHLRKSKGNVIFTSTGAVVNAYSSWGSYGASKSALKSLGSTLAVEEPDIISLSIAPGVVDTDMQKAIRDRHVEVMDEKDKAKFIGLHEDGKLLRPEQPGYVIAKLALDAPKNLSGQFLR